MNLSLSAALSSLPPIPSRALPTTTTTFEGAPPALHARSVPVVSARHAVLLLVLLRHSFHPASGAAGRYVITAMVNVTRSLVIRGSGARRTTLLFPKPLSEVGHRCAVGVCTLGRL